MILSAAGELFSTSPYSEVSTQEVAEAAETSQALVFHYFTSKAGLYTAWLEQVLDSLAGHVAGALRELPAGTGRRDTVRVGLEAFTAFIEQHPTTWQITQRAGDEPEEAINLRLERRDEVYDHLLELLQPESARGRYAIAGAIGYFEAACMEWADASFPPEEKWPMIESVLGALEGALGDWGG